MHQMPLASATATAFGFGLAFGYLQPASAVRALPKQLRQQLH